MLYRQIKTGDRVEISLLEDEGGNPHITQVEAVHGKDDVAIYAPLSYGHIIRLGINRKYAFLFYTDKGMVRFIARVKRHGKEDGFDMTYIALEDDGASMQRREFYRFSCLLPFQFTLGCKVKQEDKEDIIEEPMYDAVINDISGGGLRFVSNEHLEEKEFINTIMTLDRKTIFVDAEILTRSVMVNMLYKYQYSVKYHNIATGDRETIVQFIFSQQRKRLRGEG